MEKILFIACCNIDMDSKTGVSKKIFNQRMVFAKYYDVYLLGFAEDGINVIHDNNVTRIKSKNRRKERIKQSIKLCKNLGIHKCFIRTAAIEPYYIRLLKELKALDVNIVMEIPTYPYDGELLDTVRHKVILHIDRVLRKYIKSYVSRIATYSDDREIYGVPAINLTNGLDVVNSEFSIDKSDSIHFIGVANISNWHGFDRLIKGLANYSGIQEVVFDVVGTGDALVELQNLVTVCGLEDKVIFHGFLSGDKLSEVYRRASIGVDHLGLHRKGLDQISSLKSGEYASKGLPILTSANIKAIESDWPYIIHTTSDEHPVDIEDVLKQYNKIRAIDGFRTNIREYALQKFDIRSTFQPVIEYFKE